ncbi:hypothetical protein RF55_17135 [Lasius niger]|uniref:Uncharacterized protein n=1 Tax=Lasius niger TaxID=67767 RepID=A0A0J7K387_LASNI|nr:hypothetical protein RF55_17135 [Lasius niger]
MHGTERGSHLRVRSQPNLETKGFITLDKRTPFETEGFITIDFRNLGGAETGDACPGVLAGDQADDCRAENGSGTARGDAGERGGGNGPHNGASGDNG